MPLLLQPRVTGDSGAAEIALDSESDTQHLSLRPGWRPGPLSRIRGESESEPRPGPKRDKRLFENLFSLGLFAYVQWPTGSLQAGRPGFQVPGTGIHGPGAPSGSSAVVTG